MKKIWKNGYLLIPRLSLSQFQLRLFLNNYKGKKRKKDRKKREKESAQFCFRGIIPHKCRYFNKIKSCLKKNLDLSFFSKFSEFLNDILLSPQVQLDTWRAKIIVMRTNQKKVDMKQMYISVATKINDYALMYELLIASQVVGSKFEEILTSRKLRIALSFTSSHEKSKNVANDFHESNVSFIC